MLVKFELHGEIDNIDTDIFRLFTKTFMIQMFFSWAPWNDSYIVLSQWAVNGLEWWCHQDFCIESYHSSMADDNFTSLWHHVITNSFSIFANIIVLVEVIFWVVFAIYHLVSWSPQEAFNSIPCSPWYRGATMVMAESGRHVILWSVAVCIANRLFS